MSTCREAALAYLKRGWAVLPLVPRGKKPLINRGVHGATKSAKVVEEWFKRRPNANVGIACGRASGLFVLDVDPQKGGLDSLKALENLHGKFVEYCPRVRTGSGGMHIYFKPPTEPLHNSAGRLGDGLDTRSDGGFVVAPPSQHASGGSYEWIQDVTEAGPPTIPLWMGEELNRSSGPTRLSSEWADLILGGVSEGSRNDTVTRLSGYLLRRGLPEDVVEALMLVWNDGRVSPPLDEEEVLRTLRSVAQLEGRRRG